jgi:uncharacterized OB-fold protein
VKGAFEIREGVPTLLGVRCGRCDVVTLPAQLYGCTTCGAPEACLTDAPLGVRGEVVATVDVPASADGTIPRYTVAEVRLDDGPVVRCLAVPGITVGDRVTARIEDFLGKDVLRFSTGDAP